MQAVIFPEPRTVIVDTIADPTPKDDEVVVRVRRAGICSTDVHIYRNEYMSTFPIIPGHEFAGEVAEVGKNVTALKVNDRVAVDPNLYCGQCDMCRRQAFNHCLHWQGVGITRPGAFAEYVAVPARACYRLPAHITEPQSVFIEPLSCVVWAMQRLQVDPGDEVLIFGAGPMGLLLVQALRHRGASQLVVVDIREDRLAMAAKLGATSTIVAGPNQEALLSELAPHGFLVVIDVTGVPQVIERATQYLRPRGRYLQFGVAPKGTKVAMQPYELFRNDWTLLGSFALCYSFDAAIAWLSSGQFDVESLVSDTLALNQFPQAFDRFAAGEVLKIHLQP